MSWSKDKYLTDIEIEDLKASRKERVKGLTKRFASVEDLFAWLDTEKVRSFCNEPER